MCLFGTHLYTETTSSYFLGAYFSFLLPCLQVTKNFNQMKDRAFFFFKACCQREPLCYFTNLLGCHSNLLEMKSWYFPDKSSVTGLRAYGLRESAAFMRCVQDLLDEMWPTGRVPGKTGPVKTQLTSHNVCCVEFPSTFILVKSRASCLGCWVEVWCYSDYKNLSFLLNTNWIIFSESRDCGYFIKLLLVREGFSKRTNWICDGKIQVW